MVAVDFALLRLQREKSSASLQTALEKLKTSAKFPTTKTLNLPEMRPFEDFIKLNLEQTLALKQPLSFFKSLPFNPSAAQSVAAVLEEIGGRMKKLQMLLNEPPRSGNAGMVLGKQLLKIFRSNVPATGLLALIGGQQPQGAPPAVRINNYFLSLLSFLKNYSSCLKLDTEMDHFDLVYQSCYGVGLNPELWWYIGIF